MGCFDLLKWLFTLECTEFLDFCFPWRYNMAVLEELIRGQPSQALSWEDFLDWDWLSSEVQQGGPPVLTYRSYDYDVPALQVSRAVTRQKLNYHA